MLAFTTGAVYLMFLEHSEQDVYEPLSGQVFPTASVDRIPKRSNEHGGARAASAGRAGSPRTAGSPGTAGEPHRA